MADRDAYLRRLSDLAIDGQAVPHYDQDMRVTDRLGYALPISPFLSVTSNGYALGIPTVGEVLLETDAVPASAIPDGESLTISLEASQLSNFATIDATFLLAVLTGSGGNGVPAFSQRAGLPVLDSPVFIRAKVVGSAGVLDAGEHGNFYVGFIF